MEGSKKLVAFVSPASGYNDSYCFDIAGWAAEEAEGRLILTTTLSDTQQKTLRDALASLNAVLLALFVNDRIPRRIQGFDHKHPCSHHMDLGTPFSMGGVGSNLRADNRDSFKVPGIIYRPNVQQFGIKKTPGTDINSWYDVIAKDPVLAGSLTMLQEGFAGCNIISSGAAYRNVLDLANSIILLVAGLESLFTRNADDTADIGFKFKTVGALYYHTYAATEYLSLNGKREKLSYTDFKRVLGALYGIRSIVAHGKANTLLGKDGYKKWKILQSTLGAADNRESLKSEGYVLGDYIFVLCLLQIHIFALIIGAKDQLKHGVEIIDTLAVLPQPIELEKGTENH